jgi:hypothetical protein
MELPFSALASKGPDAMAIAAARLSGTGLRSDCAAGTNGTHLMSQGGRAVIFAPGNADASAVDKVEQSG